MKTEDLAFVALGSNLGDSRGNVLSAMDRLQQLSDAPILKSSLWESTPVDCPPDSPRFINAVAALEPRTDETPESLLAKLGEIERGFGRLPKKVLNEPRTVDLDLIAFKREIRGSPQLTLPHPRARNRRFVLQPLAEIAPGLVLPGELESIALLLSRLAPEPDFRLLA